MKLKTHSNETNMEPIMSKVYFSIYFASHSIVRFPNAFFRLSLTALFTLFNRKISYSFRFETIKKQLVRQ